MAQRTRAVPPAFLRNRFFVIAVNRKNAPAAVTIMPIATIIISAISIVVSCFGSNKTRSDSYPLNCKFLCVSPPTAFRIPFRPYSWGISADAFFCPCRRSRIASSLSASAQTAAEAGLRPLPLCRFPPLSCVCALRRL